jgi:hypothetical protein
MTVLLRLTIIAILASGPSFAYTQSDCNELKKVQTDGSGREVDTKLQVDGQGSCKPHPLNSTDGGAPASRQPPPGNLDRREVMAPDTIAPVTKTPQ